MVFPVAFLLFAAAILYSGFHNMTLTDAIRSLLGRSPTGTLGSFDNSSDSDSSGGASTSDSSDGMTTTGNLKGGTPNGTSVPSASWNPDHKPICNWIIPILQWASKNGWSGTVTSGYRTPAEEMAAAESYGLSHYGPAGPLASNHCKKHYPGGAVDVTQQPQLNSVLKKYPAKPNLVWGGPVIGDTVHFSATGH